jgi:hypothetical protein
VAVLLVAVVGFQVSRHSVPDQVSDLYETYRAGQMDLAVHTPDAAEVERFFGRAPIGFTSRVIDLRMMAYAIEGGALATIDGHASAVVAYRGLADETLLCAMYQGLTTDLPPPDVRTAVDGIDFLVYHRDGLTLVFWQEGELVCILAGSADSQVVLDLAAAKALKGTQGGN